MSQSPLITVGMPVYNGERFLEQAVNSILAQTLGDFELIISDNASTDGTEAICRRLAASDARIRYVRQPKNLGAAENYNFLVAQARAPFFRWHNADDLIETQSHQLCWQALQDDRDAVMAFGKTKIIDARGEVLEEYEDNIHLPDQTPYQRYVRFRQNVGQTNAIYGLMRLNALKKTHLFRKFQASDTNFMGELCLYGKFIRLPQFLFYRRMHEGASSWDRKNKKVQRDFWNPAAKSFNFQYIRRHFVCYSDVLTADIAPSQKAKILAYLLKRTRYDRTRLRKDLVYSLKHKM